MKEETSYVGTIIVLILLLVLGLIIVCGAFYTIDSGERGVLLTFGKVNPTPKTEGLHFKIPIAQEIVKFDTRTQKYEAQASAASKDLQIVQTNLAVNYHLTPERVVELYTEIGTTFNDRVIQPSVQEVTKAVTAQFTAEELITKRPLAKEQIVMALKERLDNKGIIVDDISITNFDFSHSFNEAIEAKVTAEQLKLKAGNDLERIRIEAEQIEAKAIGDKLASIARAEGQAQSIQIVDQQLRNSPQYVKWYMVDKWDGRLSLVSGGSTPLINIPLTQE